eukprot:16684-Heterococcus_DN1.PRE.4
MAPPFTRLVNAGAFKVGDKLSCLEVVDGAALGFEEPVEVEVVQSSKTRGNFDLRFRKPNSNNYVTANNPTTALKLLLPKDHHLLNSSKKWKGWKYFVYQGRTLQQIRQQYEQKSQRPTHTSTAAGEDRKGSDHDVEMDSQSDDDDDDVYTIESLPINTQQDQKLYDELVERLKNGLPCPEHVKLKCLDITKHCGAEDTVFQCIAIGALGFQALQSEVMMRTLRSIAADSLSNTDEKHRMAIGLLPAGQNQLQSLADGLGVIITLLETPMAAGHHQFELKPGTPGVTENMRRSCTTYRPTSADGSTASTAVRHIILQCVQKPASDDEVSEEQLHVDLVNLVTQIDIDDDDNEMKDERAAAGTGDNSQDHETLHTQNLSYDNSDADGTPAGLHRALKAVLQMIQRNLLARLAALANTDQAFLIAEAQANLDRVNTLPQTFVQTLESAKEVHIFLAGFSGAGKSTLGSANAQEGIQRSTEYYQGICKVDQPAFHFTMIDTTGGSHDSVTSKAELEKAMSHLCKVLYEKAKHIFHRYDLYRCLSSQKVGATTTAAVTVRSCGTGAPYIVVKW